MATGYASLKIMREQNLAKNAEERGGRGGNVVRILCPLIITQAECEEMIKRFTKSVEEALKAVRG